MSIAESSSCVGCTKPDLVEYAVRSTSRFLVTRYESNQNGAASEVIGEFDSAANAERVAEGMANSERGERGGNVHVYRPYLDTTPNIGRASKLE